tara:strand:- start:422 stop:622 length:201 start_codon:yes stop_codon:yes gene_type:complete
MSTTRTIIAAYDATIAAALAAYRAGEPLDLDNRCRYLAAAKAARRAMARANAAYGREKRAGQTAAK